MSFRGSNHRGSFDGPGIEVCLNSIIDFATTELTRQGNGEYFAWSDIPGEAILHTADLTSLVEQLNNDPDCRRLLNFDAFRAGARTKQIAAALRERNALLNTATARALGKIAKLFGMGKGNV
jgi:hypothetical protein